jgi:hypothetical protein
MNTQPASPDRLVDGVGSGGIAQKRALEPAQESTTDAPVEQELIVAQVVHRARVDLQPRSLSPSLYEFWCADVQSRPVTIRRAATAAAAKTTQQSHNDAIIVPFSTTLVSGGADGGIAGEGAAAGNAPPRASVVYFMERCDHSNAVAWREMLALGCRLRSLIAVAFPLLHQRSIGVYWCRPRNIATSARSLNLRGELFFNAAALDPADVFRCFLTICHELTHNVEADHNTRFVHAFEQCLRAHFGAFWGYYINHLHNADSSV